MGARFGTFLASIRWCGFHPRFSRACHIFGLELASGPSLKATCTILTKRFEAKSMTLLPILAEDMHLGPQKLRGSLGKIVTTAPPGTVLLGILKSVEAELRKRDLFGTILVETTPLWFIAETERNVFLWRSGRSIADHRDFAFWIDIRALIEKRRGQLNRATGFNPFICSMWNSPGEDTQALDQERDYLTALEDLLGSIFKHAEALSRASETVRAEIAPESHERVLVVLPVVTPSSE